MHLCAGLNVAAKLAIFCKKSIFLIAGLFSKFFVILMMTKAQSHQRISQNLRTTLSIFRVTSDFFAVQFLMLMIT